MPRATPRPGRAFSACSSATARASRSTAPSSASASPTSRSMPDSERLAHARAVRQRLQELTDELGVRFPIYVAVHQGRPPGRLLGVLRQSRPRGARAGLGRHLRPRRGQGRDRRRHEEGRKYGVYLGLITQRRPNSTPPLSPSATRCSRCVWPTSATKALLRAAVSDAAANLLSFVPSLGTREVKAFGEGVTLPTRLRFKEIAKAPIATRGEAAISSVPSVTSGHKTCISSAPCSGGKSAAPTSQRDDAERPGILAAAAQRRSRPMKRRCCSPRAGLDPDRFSLLKKPLR